MILRSGPRVPPIVLPARRLDDSDPDVRVPNRSRAGQVGADEVAGDDVAGGPGKDDRDAELAIAADDIAFKGVADAVGIGADEVIGGDADADAVQTIAESDSAADVGADEVAGNDVVIGGHAGDAVEAENDAVLVIAADQVPLGGIVDTVAVGADDVRRGLVVDADAVLGVADLGSAGCISADAIALDQVAGGSGTEDVDADAVVAGNKVARASRTAADDIVRGLDGDAAPKGTAELSLATGAVPAALVPM